jgi:hypothetical protein
MAGCVLFLCGCSVQKNDMKKLRDIEFTVIDEQKLPIELKEYIEEAKAEPFEITYGDEGYLYIAKGYGKKDTSGYSIEVEECFETSNILYLKTKLLGPPKTEKIVEEDTFPYIVLKTEYSDKSVVFE